jgi:hypothetical protein
MNRTAGLCLLPFLLPAALGTARAAADVPTAAVESLSVAPRFFPSCLLDLSDRLSGPAGNKGFLFIGTDGHFYFADGTRARFWGLNVAKDSVFQPHETIDRVCDLFARAGINLVRLHHLDDVGGLLPPDRAGLGERLEPTALDRVDYWIAALKKRGIYVYLDLLDYRTFTEAEGVTNAALLGRAAKPVALFNEKLINLQMEFARDLLVRHVNPYTGLHYRDDPGICLIEICDENSVVGTFSKWASIPSPYREELIRRWNFWLREQYGTTEALQRAWGVAPPPPAPVTPGQGPAPAPAGTPGGVGPTEKLETGTVALPGVSPDLGTYGVREPDLRRFAAGLERDYLKQMVAFLRSLGVQAPITAVTEPDSPASLLAAADTLDFITGNYYYAHPVYKDTYPPGVKGTFEVSNMLSTYGPDTAARRLCGSRVAGKPLVIREWNCCWPNPYRAAGLVEAAALAARQDLDAMILFSYYTQPETMTLSPFDLSRDPSLWGLVGLAGELYRDPGLGASGPRVAVLWGRHDIYDEPRGAMAGDVFDAARFVGMENWLPRHQGQRADAYALVSSAAGELLPKGTEDDVCVTGASMPSLSMNLMALLNRLRVKQGSLRYDAERGTLVVTGRNVRGLAGQALGALQSPDEALSLVSATPRMALLWLSRDGKRPGESREWVAKMTTGAWNSGEQVRPHYNGNGMNVAALLAVGVAPVTTGGKPADTPTTLSVGGKPVLSLWLRGGVWELHQTRTCRRLYCDTGDVRFEFPDLSGAVPAAQTPQGAAALAGPPWSYPEGAAWVEVAVPAG